MSAIPKFSSAPTIGRGRAPYVRRIQISDVAGVVCANAAAITPVVEQQRTELACRDVGTVRDRTSVTHFREFRLFGVVRLQIIKADGSVLVGAR